MGKFENQGPLPFRYNSISDDNEEFRNQIKEARAPRITGSPQYIWETKLKNMRARLKEWARANEIRREKRKTELQNEMESMQTEKENKEEDKQDYLREKEIF